MGEGRDPKTLAGESSSMSTGGDESIGAQLNIDTAKSQDAVEELRRDIDNLNKAMDFLTSGFRKGTIEEDKFNVASKLGARRTAIQGNDAQGCDRHGVWRRL